MEEYKVLKRKRDYFKEQYSSELKTCFIETEKGFGVQYISKFFKDKGIPLLGEIYRLKSPIELNWYTPVHILSSDKKKEYIKGLKFPLLLYIANENTLSSEEGIIQSAYNEFKIKQLENKMEKSKTL